MSRKWFVITGGPSSGITVTADYIAMLGHHTVPETARVFIDGEIAKGREIGDIRKDELSFQMTVFRMKQELEIKIPKDKIVFFQRGIPDTLAYHRLLGADTKDIYDICKKSQYGKVFILEPVGLKKDYARIENEETAVKIFHLLKEAYNELGFPIITVPKMTIEERANMILAEIF